MLRSLTTTSIKLDELCLLNLKNCCISVLDVLCPPGKDKVISSTSLDDK